MTQEKSFTTGEIAAFCQVSYRTVLTWIEDGKLTSYRTPGGHNRIRQKDCLVFLKKYGMPIPERLKNGDEKKRILIVDDDKNMVRAIMRMFDLENTYDIVAAFDGFDAGRKLLEFKPHLVLLDIRMPGMDGYEVARRIKESDDGKYIKIITISAYFEEEGEQKMLSLGVDACLAKPFESQELLALIEKVLG